MPGIVGIVSDKPAEECERLVNAMIACTKHEPFYTSGSYPVSKMGLYAGWVAHQSSFAADQVFFNEQKDIALIFSGECFPESEAQSAFERRGDTLLTDQGNWLVHLYEQDGDRFFEKLNGLFSGLLIDKRQGKAFLFNDRFGVERIYWHKANDAFYFASESKALLRILPRLREFDPNGVAQFLTYGCTLEGQTLFRDVHLLPSASLWAFENGNCRKTSYFSPANWESQPVLSAERFENEFEETFKKVLPRYFKSESEIGISLTGGLDSRMIMACLPETAKKPLFYTFLGEQRD